METPTLSFVIPTYRLRDVNETVESYDQHFWKNGHSVRIGWMQQIRNRSVMNLVKRQCKEWNSEAYNRLSDPQRNWGIKVLVVYR